jgi:hypothetical protein
MDKTLYATLAMFAMTLPNVVDRWLQPKIQSPRLFVVFAVLVGALFGGIAAGLTRFSSGAVAADARDVFFAGFGGGIIAGVMGIMTNRPDPAKDAQNTAAGNPLTAKKATPMFKYALLSLTPRITASDMVSMVSAAALVADRFCAAWGLTGIQGRVITDAKDASADEVLFTWKEKDDAVPGAEGFHDEQGNKPYGELLASTVLDNGGNVLGPLENSCSGVFTHELWETLIDLYANEWISMPDGRFLAKEVADPVQGSEFFVTLADKAQVAVSDAVFPRYFDAQATNVAPQEMSLSGVVKAPFQLLPGGYQIIFDPSQLNSKDGPISNVFGAKMPAHIIETKKVSHRNRTRMERV